MEKFILANNCALRYYDTQSDKPCIVLVHGYFESIEIWSRIIPELSKHYRIIAFDVPGHGISEVLSECHSMEFLADTLNDILIKSNINKCIVAGHSAGGYIALKFAEKYSEKTARLVLFHSIFDSDSPERKCRRDKEIEIIKSNKKELLAKINPGKAIAKINHKELAEVILEMEDQAMMTEDEGAIALLNGIKDREDMNKFVESTTIPITAFWGEEDEFIPLEYAKEVAEKHKKVDSIFIKDCGHLCFIEQMPTTLQTLISFVAN